MVYNLTGIAGNTTSILTMVQGINSELMFGWLGTLILVGFSIVLFIAFYTSSGEVNKTIAATSFISFSLALALRALDLVPNLAIFISLILLAVSLAFAWKQ